MVQSVKAHEFLRPGFLLRCSDRFPILTGPLLRFSVHTKKEIDMTQRMFRICILLTLGFAASQTILRAQERNGLEGIWNVSVNVTNCQTGAPIRTVASLQQFRPNGSMIETANTASRGISEGVWGSADDKNVAALYWFYRYNPDGTFASRARSRIKSLSLRMASSPQLASSSTMTRPANYSRPAASRTPLPA
jgi:hypothetical protein